MKLPQPEYEILMISAVANANIYFLFRGNGEEVKIDLLQCTTTHQLKFNEMNYIEENYPFIKIYKFKVNNQL